MRSLSVAALCGFLQLSAICMASDQLAGVINVEDFAPLAGSDWVIGSSMAGGEYRSGSLLAIHAKTNEVIKLFAGELASTDRRSKRCAAPVAAQNFAPHGITVAAPGEGQTLLYVVNHGERESIEQFSLRLTPKPRLDWIDCIPMPAGAFANAVAMGPNGNLYISNMGLPLDGSPALSPMGGNILFWNAAQGWQSVADSAVIAPNGLLVSEDGQQLFVASWSTGQIIKLSAFGQSPRRVLTLPFLPDNLRWSPSGEILVTGQQTSVETVTSCYVSTRNHCQIPSAAAVVDPESWTPRCSLSVPLDMATVAAPVGRQLWIGSARNDRILTLPLEILDSKQCRPAL